MITAVDSNVFVALWDAEHALNALAHSALETALQRGRITLAAPAYAELMAGPGRTEGLSMGFAMRPESWSIGNSVKRSGEMRDMLFRVMLVADASMGKLARAEF